jgi:hypothetical protein
MVYLWQRREGGRIFEDDISRLILEILSLRVLYYTVQRADAQTEPSNEPFKYDFETN